MNNIQEIQGEGVAQNFNRNNTVRRTKQYDNTKSGRRRRAHTDGPQRRKQSESKQNMEQKALRFPRGEGVMPPVVWGLQCMLFFPISSTLLQSCLCYCPGNPSFSQRFYLTLDAVKSL